MNATTVPQISGVFHGTGFRPLDENHGQDGGATGRIELDSPLALTHGGRLCGAHLGYRLSGRAGAPVVLVMGGISAHRRVDGDGGWWSEIAGPGRALDPDEYAILGFDWLGGCGESTHAAGDSFPLIDALDQAACAVRLLDALGIGRLHAVIGASYGGQVALQLLREYPERLRRAVVIGAAHRPHPLGVALRGIQRRIVSAGIESGRPGDAVALARELAMVSYRSAEEFGRRFDAPAVAGDDRGVRHPIQAYLGHCGTKFARQFGPWAYLRLSASIDLHAVEPERIAAPFDLVGFRSDLLVPPGELEALAAAAPGCRSLTILDSIYGHDGFLKESAQLAPIIHHLLEPSRC